MAKRSSTSKTRKPARRRRPHPIDKGPPTRQPARNRKAPRRAPR